MACGILSIEGQEVVDDQFELTNISDRLRRFMIVMMVEGMPLMHDNYNILKVSHVKNLSQGEIIDNLEQ